MNNQPSTINKIIAQCIIARLDINKYLMDKNYSNYIKNLVNIGIGGFCVFNGTISETKEVISEMQGISEISLLFCADFENGLKMRLSDGISFPHSMALAQTGNPENTYKVAHAIAIEAKKLGIYWNLAPVCDINSNKNNPIINIRSFGESPEEVIPHIKNYIKATQSANVLACAKHYPGHGDTEIDSHIDLPVLNKTYNNIKNNELRPFIAAIENDVKSIMIAHLSLPLMEDDDVPSSLSDKLIKNILINELGYDKIIITDSLDMHAITKRYSSKLASEMALRAGNNVLLMPPDIVKVIQHIEIIATKDNDLRNHIEKSCEKLIEAKDWCNKPQVENIYNSNHNHENLALNIAYDGIKIIGNKSLIPIEKNKQIAAFIVMQDDDMDSGSYFFQLLAQGIENDCDFGFIDENISEKEIDDLTVGIENADLLLLAFFYKAKAYLGSVGISDKISYIINRLSKYKAQAFPKQELGNENKRPVIAILFGNPYIIDKIPGDLHIQAFSDSLPSIAATVMHLCAKEKVTINN